MNTILLVLMAASLLEAKLVVAQPNDITINCDPRMCICEKIGDVFVFKANTDLPIDDLDNLIIIPGITIKYPSDKLYHKVEPGKLGGSIEYKSVTKSGDILGIRMFKTGTGPVDVRNFRVPSGSIMFTLTFHRYQTITVSSDSIK